METYIHQFEKTEKLQNGIDAMAKRFALSLKEVERLKKLLLSPYVKVK